MQLIKANHMSNNMQLVLAKLFVEMKRKMLEEKKSVSKTDYF